MVPIHTENTRLISRELFSVYYDIFDYDTSTSLTHFVNFAAFTVSMTLNDFESRSEVI